MGNRAVITTKYNFENNGVGIYLHWNGGRDSVEAFLKYMELRGFRSPDVDCYGWARLCQVIGNYFGGTLSVGIDVINRLDCDNWDNGTYIIEGWKIVGREFFDGAEQKSYDLVEMMKDIDEKQPSHDQLGKEFLDAGLVNKEELRIGDIVFDYDNVFEEYRKYQVMGIGNGTINGEDVTGIPYVADVGTEETYDRYISNYLKNKQYRVCRKY